MIVHTGLGIPRKNLRGIYIRSGVRQRSWGKTNVYGKRGLKRGTHQFGDAGRYLFIYRCGFLQRRTFGILGTGEWMTAVNLWMGDRNSERLDRRQVTLGQARPWSTGSRTRTALILNQFFQQQQLPLGWSLCQGGWSHGGTSAHPPPRTIWPGEPSAGGTTWDESLDLPGTQARNSVLAKSRRGRRSLMGL